MMKPIEAILVEKPQARPRIYAYSIADAAHAGLLKIGQTTREVKQRVARYEDASLRYTGIDSHPGLRHYGLYDTVVAREEARP
jgi:hypothetical protein